MKGAAPVVLCFALASCGHRDEGLTLTVTAQFESPLREVNVSGQSVAVTQAQLQVAFVELLPCPESTLARWLSAFSPIGTAHAHGAEAALRSTEPSSLNLLSQSPQRAGVVHPPPGSYCGVRVLVGPTPVDKRSLWLTPGMETSEVRTLAFSLPSFELNAERLKADLVLSLHASLWFEGVDLSGNEAGNQVLTRMVASP